MDRKRFVTLVMAAIVIVGTIRLAPMAFALTTAAVSFNGSYSVGGAGTKFISCSLSPTAVTLPKPPKGSSTTTATATLTCTNSTATTVGISIVGSSMSPGGNKTPSYQWATTGGTPSTTISLGSGSSASRIVTFTRDNNDNDGPFTFTFDVTGTSSPSVLDYTRTGFTVTIN